MYKQDKGFIENQLMISLIVLPNIIKILRPLKLSLDARPRRSRQITQRVNISSFLQILQLPTKISPLPLPVQAASNLINIWNTPTTNK